MLFNFLLLANFFQYMEAGALPALLLSISNSFGMNSAQQGLLGGVVYLSLGTGGPFAGYLLPCGELLGLVVLEVAIPTGDVSAMPDLKKTHANAAQRSEGDERKDMPLDSSSQSINEMSHTGAVTVSATSAGGRGESKGMSTQRWMNLQTLDEVEERKHRLSWRRSSLSASMYDPLSTRDIIKRSHDDIALLDPADLTGFRWTGSSQAPSPFDQPTSSNGANALSRAPVSPDASKSSPPTASNRNAYSIGGVVLDEGSMRDGGKHSKPASPSNDPPKALLLLHKSPSFDSISRANQANVVSFAPFSVQQVEEGSWSTISTAKRGSLGSNAPSIHYEPLKYESLKEVKRKSLSDDMTQHIHFFHPSTPNTSIKPSRGGEVLTAARRPRAQSFELHTLHTAGSPTVNTLRKVRHSDTYLAATEHTPLLRSEVSTPQVNGRLGQGDEKTPATWSSWLSSWFGRKEDMPEEASINRVLYQHDSFRGREKKQFKTLEMNVAIDPESDSQSGSDSEDEWMEYSPLKQRSFTFPETPQQTLSTPTPLSPRNSSGYATSSNVSHNLGGRILDSLVYCLRCCRRERRHHHGHKKSWWKSVKALLCLPVYRNLLGAMSALYFTVTGVQYWGTKYLLISLHAPLLLVNVLFVLCAATGPVMGVFFGGYIIDAFGGYKGYKKRVSALKLVCTLGLIGCVSTLPITFLDNIYFVILFLWLVLFFGGSSLPACAGILVSVVPRHHRPTSASLSLVVFNMCGYCLSLILSGLLMQVLEGYSDVCDAVCAMTWGFRLILFWSFFSFFFLVSAYMSARKYLHEREIRELQYERHQAEV
eukprot:gene31198-37705_t